MLALLFTQLQPQTATTVVRMLTPQRPRAMVLTDWAPTLGTGDDDDAVDVVSGDVVEQFLQRQREELKLRSKSGRDLLAAARGQDAKLQADALAEIGVDTPEDLHLIDGDEVPWPSVVKPEDRKKIQAGLESSRKMPLGRKMSGTI